MAYYVRKFARSKWHVLEENAENEIGNYNADTIANDLRTQGNTLSLWKVDSLSDEDIEPVIVINSLLGDTISRIELIFIPEKELMPTFSLEKVPGDTVVSEYSNLHYNVTSLSVNKHVLFAKNIMLKLISYDEEHEGEKDYQPLIRKFNEKQQLKLINKWINQGAIDFTQLKEKQKNTIKKYIDKSQMQN